MTDLSALLEELIVAKLEKTPEKKIVATGYDGLLEKFGLSTRGVSISQFRKALGRLGSKHPKQIRVTYSERQGISDMEPRDICITLL